MGYSSLIMILTIIVLSMIITHQLIMSASEFQDETMNIRDYGKKTGDIHRASINFADFNVTNITPQLLNITFYLVNNGSGNIPTGCEDVIIDGVWVKTSNKSNTIIPTAFDEFVFNPSETLLVSVLHSIAVGEYNATVIACNGLSATMLFNASKCGDDLCHGGEYCDLDNYSCPDNVCYEPKCAGGCIELPITDDDDPGECDSSGVGCSTDTCTCDYASTCCGVDGSAGCTLDSHCCSNICFEGVCQSGITVQVAPQDCSAAEKELSADSFPDVCDGIYPDVCGNNRDELSCDDNMLEESDAGYTEYCGVKAEYYDSSILDCDRVNQVTLCHETWLNSAAASDCDISVSKDGTSWVEVNSTCTINKNPGVMCQDISSAYTWTCGDFFGGSGSFIRYNAQNQENKNGKCSTDVLYYLVEYKPQ